MDKCEWKDGNLYQCDKRPHMDSIPFTVWNFCPYCGADIRKPDPKHTAETLAEKYILSEPIIFSPEYINQKVINDIKRQAFIAGAKADIPPEAE